VDIGRAVALFATIGHSKIPGRILETCFARVHYKGSKMKHYEQYLIPNGHGDGCGIALNQEDRLFSMFRVAG
jgi:hypothetical protein